MENVIDFTGDDASLFEQRRRVRRVRMILDLTSTLLSRDASLTHREACTLVECAERAIAELLPNFSSKFSSFVRPRLERIIQERWPAPFDDRPARRMSQELVN
jgi:hypothetical protein